MSESTDVQFLKTELRDEASLNPQMCEEVQVEICEILECGHPS